MRRSAHCRKMVSLTGPIVTVIPRVSHQAQGDLSGCPLWKKQDRSGQGKQYSHPPGMKLNEECSTGKKGRKNEVFYTAGQICPHLFAPSFLRRDPLPISLSAYGHKRGNLPPHTVGHIRSYAPALLRGIPSFLLHNSLPISLSASAYGHKLVAPRPSCSVAYRGMLHSHSGRPPNFLRRDPLPISLSAYGHKRGRSPPFVSVS